MTSAYVCNRIKELCADYKDALRFQDTESARIDLNRILSLCEEFEKEQKIHFDSAFFGGELDYNAGEKEVEYPDTVENYRRRRRKRKDNKAVKKFRDRRKKRLDDRAEDLDWITVENGEHVPLKNGKAVGGPLNGRDFSNAKSTKKSGTFKYERPQKQEKTLQRMIKRTANLKKEQYRVIDSDGNVVIESKGDKGSVGTSVGEKREKMQGNISLHNHPEGGTFSAPDLRDFGFGAREIVAASPEGTYSLVNTRYGQKDQYDGWLAMQRDLENSVPEASPISLMIQARKNLENCAERKRMAEISNEFVKRKNNGESLDSLREWIASTDYTAQEESYKKKVKDETRRLEVEPFDTFYKENAEKYGFKYTFTKTHHDSIEAFRQRRQKRLDAKDDEDGHWVTTENDHHVHINEEGVPDKGNPYVLNAMTSGPKTRQQIVRGRVEKIKTKVDSALKTYRDEDEKVQEVSKDYYEKMKAFQKVEHRLDMVDKIYKKNLTEAGYEEKDEERLQKEVEELKKQLDEDPRNSDIEAQYNNKRFLLAEWEECYGEETQQMRKEYGGLKKAHDDAKQELQKHADARKSALTEARKAMGERDAQSMKFYSDEERQTIKDSVINCKGFEVLTDDEKEAISASIDGASDAQLATLKKSIEHARIMRYEDTVMTAGCSHYMESNGIIYLEEEDRKSPRTFWHEFGHYMDDFQHSGLDDSVVTYGEGTPYESRSKSFSDILEDVVKIRGEDAVKDMQEMLDSVMPDRFEVTTNSDGTYIGVRDKKVGTYADQDMSLRWDLQKSFDKVIDNYLDGGENGGEIADYYRSIGYPSYEERPDRGDYMESYTTPKRKLEREREKYKGAEEEYYKKLNEFYAEQERVKSEHPDFDEKVSEMYGRKREREKHIPAVTDCLCGVLGGATFSIYGCHDPNYYRTGRHVENEWSANIHQMMFMRDTEAIGLLSKLMPRTMKKVKSAYNEYLWRNMAI